MKYLFDGHFAPLVLHILCFHPNGRDLPIFFLIQRFHSPERTICVSRFFFSRECLFSGCVPSILGFLAFSPRFQLQRDRHYLTDPLKILPSYPRQPSKS